MLIDVGAGDISVIEYRFKLIQERIPKRTVYLVLEND